MLSLFLQKSSPDTLFFEKNSPCTLSFTDVDSMDNRIDIMVDGSGDGHSIALFPGEEVYVAYERGASNNEAEFNAVILALENLPDRSRARIRTDSQVVVWHLTRKNKTTPPAFFRKSQEIQDLIVEKDLSVEIRWIPRSENGADRHLRHYIQSLCGAAGNEPLHRRVRRLEAENLRLKAKLRKAMKMLENRPVIIRDAVQPSWEMMES
jgi:ribonuclease HI